MFCDGGVAQFAEVRVTLVAGAGMVQPYSD